LFDPYARGSAGFAFTVVTPSREPTSAAAIADEVGVQPTRQSMLAAGCGKAIGNQHQGAIAKRHSVATNRPGKPVTPRLHPELAQHLARHQHRPPAPRPDRLDRLTAECLIRARPAVQQTTELVEIEVLGEQIPSAKVDHRAMPGLATLAIRFDHAHIFMFDALAAGGTDQPQEHRPSLWTCPC